MTQMIEIDSFNDLLALAHQRSEPQQLLFVFTKRELPEGYTEEMKRRFDAGEGGHLAPIVCVNKRVGDLASFQQLTQEAHEMIPHWDVLFTAVLPGQNNQWPTEDQTDKALDQIVENVRGGKIGDYIAFGKTGDPLVLEGG
jgi:hypothetical protein